MGANGHILLNFFESVDAPLTSRYYLKKKDIILFLLTLHWKKGAFYYLFNNFKSDEKSRNRENKF